MRPLCFSWELPFAHCRRIPGGYLDGMAKKPTPATVASSPGMISHEKLSAYLETLPKGELLMRGDSVAFPPGGCAYLHRHQGPRRQLLRGR